MDQATKVNTINVVCPTCWEKPGNPCRSTNGHVMPKLFHVARTRRARLYVKRLNP